MAENGRKIEDRKVRGNCQLPSVGGPDTIIPMSTLLEIESAVRELPSVERVRFVEWLDENRCELLPAEVGEAVEIAEAQRREVLRRRDELLRNPALAERIDDEYFDRLRDKLADVRAGKASAG